jgi:FKBP-type peptidyl-prolyl cis-trans isomerase
MKFERSAIAAAALLLGSALTGRVLADETAKPAEPAAAKPASNIVTLENGLQYEDLKVGEGPEVAKGQTVQMRYTGRFLDGKIFDSNVGKAPYPVTLGVSSVIKGWHEGIPGMKVGGKRRLTIPPALAYGKTGYAGVIPPDATLVFEVEVLSVK